MVEQKTPSVVHKKHVIVKFKWPLAGVAFVIIAAAVTVVILRSQPLQQIDPDKYQVIYLTNGQMYFGKLKNASGDFLVMTNPYTPQSSTSTSTDNSSSTSAGTLLKVSDQLYGPEDSIAIKSSQVAFWQNLRNNSKVTQAISSRQ